MDSESHYRKPIDKIVLKPSYDTKLHETKYNHLQIKKKKS